MPKFLILRFSSIGDIVLTSPVVRCLKKQVPNAEIHFATKHAFRELTEHNPYIDKTHLLTEKLADFIKILKSENYDYIIDLHNNLRTRIIKFRLGKKSFSFNKLNYEKWLIVKFKINRLPDVHIVDRYLDTLKTFDVKNDGEGLDFFLPKNFEAKHAEEIKTKTGTDYIVFVVGANHTTKRLPREKIISIVKKIKLKVVLIGGKEDAERGATICAASYDNTVNLCGKLSLHQSAFIIKNALQVITHDTGMMHIAAAYKKPIISIWGNTIPQFGMTAYYGKNHSVVKDIIAEVKDLDCRPCSKIGFAECPKHHFKCMSKMDESFILKNIV